MKIEHLSKRERIALHRRWHPIFGEADIADAMSPTLAEDVTPDSPLFFADWANDTAALLTFRSGSKTLRTIACAMDGHGFCLFPEDLTWCAWTGHEDDPVFLVHSTPREDA